MTNFQIVESLKEKGIYKELLNKGFISLKIDLYLQMVESYNKYLKECDTKMDAITFTADDFRVSEPTIYNAIKFFKL